VTTRVESPVEQAGSEDRDATNNGPTLARATAHQRSRTDEPDAACSAPDSDEGIDVTAETNLKTLERMGEEVVGSKDLSVFDELWAEGLVDHDPAPGQGQGRDGLKDFWSQFLTAFPDLQIEVAETVSEGDKLALVYTITGTHRGPFLGVDATERRITARGLQVSRHQDDGKIVERWGQSDVHGILQQIGAAPA
jgi:steroid delta-isomerase-like uncharacterized protein